MVVAKMPGNQLVYKDFFTNPGPGRRPVNNRTIAFHITVWPAPGRGRSRLCETLARLCDLHRIVIGYFRPLDGGP